MNYLALFGGYIAVDNYREYNSITDDEAPWFLFCFVIWIIYFVLKQSNNKFINKYESIILPLIYVILPLIVAIIFAIHNI